MYKRLKNAVYDYKWLLVILLITTVLRVPSWWEPCWYGDEAIYLTIGQALRKGVQLYSQIHDNKPPFLYFAAAIADGYIFWFKFLASVWILAAIGVFYKLAEKLCESKRWVVFTTGIFALITSWPKLEGNIANAELFFLLPTVTSVWLLWDRKSGLNKIFIGGLLLGCAALFKIPAIIEAGVWPLIWLVFGDKEWWKKTMILGFGVMVPIILSLIFYWYKGALPEYLTAAWAQNIPYLSSWKATSSDTGIYSLKGRIALLFLLAAPILGWAKRIGKRGVFVGVYGLITLFASLLSGRPYPHYMLQGAGALALGSFLVIRGKISEKLIGVLVLGLFTAAAFTFHFYNYPVINYYSNFVNWVRGQKTTSDYHAWFDSQVNNNYQIASVISQGSTDNDRVFVWGDMPMIYAITRRSPAGKYTARYHIKDFKGERITMEVLNKELPKYVVSYGDDEQLPGFSSWLLNNYLLQTAAGQAKVYRLAIMGEKHE